MTLDQAIKAVASECKDSAAIAYARAAMTAATEYGTEGLRCQVMYILNNTSGWRGDTAREAKKVMKDFLKKK